MVTLGKNNNNVEDYFSLDFSLIINKLIYKPLFYLKILIYMNKICVINILNGISGNLFLVFQKLIKISY